MTLIDSNVPMYLVGAEHPYKVDARRLRERLVADGERLGTDVEVSQEILHRFVALKRRAAIQPTFEVLRDVVDEVFSIHDADVDKAKTIVLARHGLSAYDAIHVAVMEREGVQRTLTFDTGFDAAPGTARFRADSAAASCRADPHVDRGTGAHARGCRGPGGCGRDRVRALPGHLHLLILGMGDDPATDGDVRGWTRGLWRAMQPLSSGAVYVNYMDADEKDRIGEAYGAANCRRLVALKDRYGPDNLFRLNQNIVPSRSAPG